MGEAHAYGYSLGCVSRRLFVLGVCIVMAILCYGQLFRWAERSHLLASLIGDGKEAGPSACTGMQCYEIFTCYGMKDATAHVREPLVTVAGAFFLPFGISGAHHFHRGSLKLAALFFAASAMLHMGTLLADVAYLKACGQYPSNVINQVMINWMPPSPVTNAAQATLRSMAVYGLEDVARVTDGFNVERWYCALAGSLTLFLAYVATQASWLAELADRGPLGLGVHYGLGQWDEYIDREAVRRDIQKSKRSKFLEDAILPPAGSMMSYGAMGGGLAPPQVLLQDRYESDDDDEDSVVDEEAVAERAQTPLQSGRRRRAHSRT